LNLVKHRVLTMKTHTENIAAVIGAVGGAGAGMTGSAAVISAGGAVSGLSGAGIASGLSFVGGSMLGGLCIVSGGVALAALGGAVVGRRIARKVAARAA
jgi:hypothetical protein